MDNQEKLTELDKATAAVMETLVDSMKCKDKVVIYDYDLNDENHLGLIFIALNIFAQTGKDFALKTYPLKKQNLQKELRAIGIKPEVVTRGGNLSVKKVIDDLTEIANGATENPVTLGEIYNEFYKI